MRFPSSYIFTMLCSLLFVTPLFAAEPTMDNTKIEHEASIEDYRQRLAQLLIKEYHLKFKHDVANGDTIFLNSDDIRFGAIISRLRSAVYRNWVYPKKAIEKGIVGIVPVCITFNRSGEILYVELLESNGAGILFNEILRMLRTIGKIGPLPKGYDKEQLHLIVFFRYSMDDRQKISLPGGVLPLLSSKPQMQLLK